MSDFTSYENILILGKVHVKLFWNNRSMKEAESYYKKIYDEKKELSEIIDELGNGKLRSVVALLYGAIKAADPNMDINKFSSFFKSEAISTYLEVVSDGIENYMPEPERNLAEGVDESWPDTQAEKKKETGKSNHIDWGFWIWFFRKQHFSETEFMNLTLRSMIHYKKRYLLDHGDDQIYDQDRSWL